MKQTVWTILICLLLAIGTFEAVQIDISKVATSTPTSSLSSTISTTTVPEAATELAVGTNITEPSVTTSNTISTVVTTSLNATIITKVETTTSMPHTNTSWWNKAKRDVAKRLNVPSDYYCACDLTVFVYRYLKNIFYKTIVDPHRFTFAI